MGTEAMRLPRHPAVRTLGFRPEAEKWDALTGATALVMPSPHESFSFVLLEAWAQGTPVLATARVARQIPDEVARSRGLEAGIGIEFTALSQKDEQRFAAFVARVGRRAEREVVV